MAAKHSVASLLEKVSLTQDDPLGALSAQPSPISVTPMNKVRDGIWT